MRWWTHGSPDITHVMRGDTWERIEASFRVDEPTGCWRWQKTINRGYPYIYWGGRAVLAHRLVYELKLGPIPDGLHLDHTCHSSDPSCPGGPCVHRSCVNPAHLEPVTKLENTLRSVQNNVQSRKTHCPQGHPYAGENLWIVNGERRCRECSLRRVREYRARKRATAAAPEPG